MPMTPAQLNGLLDHVHARLKHCDHSHRLTSEFLRAEELDATGVLPWLRNHGGYCDCEVLFNLEDLASSFLKTKPRRKPRKRQKREPRSLDLVQGWDLSSLPGPWRVANLYSPEEPLKLQMGKKGRCAVTVVNSDLPSGDQSAPKYWSNLWHTRTKCPKKLLIEVTHEVLRLPVGFQSTLAQTQNWIYVLCWIVPEEAGWHLEVQTEVTRFQGDLPLVERLISNLHLGN